MTILWRQNGINTPFFHSLSLSIYYFFTFAQEGPRCFIRAFMAPLSWMTIMQNGTDLNKEDLKMLLWTAKPFLETMPPSSFVLPVFSQSSHLAEM